MKRWIHSSTGIREAIEDELNNFSQGRIRGLRDVEWDVSEEDARILAGLTDNNAKAIRWRSGPLGLAKVEYAPESYLEQAQAKGFDELFLMTFYDGSKRLYGWKGGQYTFYRNINQDRINK